MPRDDFSERREMCAVRPARITRKTRFTRGTDGENGRIDDVGRATENSLYVGVVGHG